MFQFSRIGHFNVGILLARGRCTGADALFLRDASPQGSGLHPGGRTTEQAGRASEARTAWGTGSRRRVKAAVPWTS